MKGQASMIDILLLALFISVVLIGSTLFIGQEELRAQKGREEAVYAQAQLVTALNYRQTGWGNSTVAQKIIADFCNGKTTAVNSTCYSADQNYTSMQNMMNRTGRTGYNYIFYVEAMYNDTVNDKIVSLGNFTVCNRQPTACAKHIPAIATMNMMVLCPGGIWIGVHYLNGIWPDWMKLPLDCD